MRVGVFTALLAQMPLEGVIAKLRGLGVSTVELGTGNYPGDPHCKLSLLEDKAARKDFKQMLDDNGISISALSCHGNPLHPDPDVAKKNQDVNRQTILLAEKLGVPVVIDFSGCPGDSDKAKYPNWVTCPWPPEYLDVLAWQWDKKVTPYWTKRPIRRGSRRQDRHRDASRLRRLQPGDAAPAPGHRGKGAGMQLRPEPHVLAGDRPDRGHTGFGRLHFPRTRGAVCTERSCTSSASRS